MAYQSTAALKAVVLDSHTATCRVEVLKAGVTVLTLDNASVGQAGVLDGDCTQDRSASIRTTAVLTLTDPDGIITPRAATDPLQPYGQEVRISRGVMVSGAFEYVPLGTLPIITATRADTGDTYTVKIEASDRGWMVGRRKSTTGGYTVAGGTNAGTAIQAIVSTRLPGLTFNFAPTTVTLPALAYDETADLWQEAIDIATALGMDLYFDRLGVCTMQPVRDPTTDPVSSNLVEGSNLISVEAASSASDTYSRTIVSGESTSGVAPVRATSVDADPSSPTYYLGPFGDVPMFLTSPLILTTGQATVVSDALLRRVKGLTEAVTLTALCDPTVDAGDVCYAKRYRAALDGRYVAETVVVGLAPDAPLQVTARRRS